MALPAQGDVDPAAALASGMRNQTHSEPGTTLFNLPIELRSLIYQDVLDDIIRPPLHPWDELPTPGMYLSLLLVNREINAEVKDLFRKLYMDRFTLYFDNLLRIHWICQNLQRWPVLHNARFWSRALLEDTDDDGDALTEGALMLIDRQSGWKEEWDAHPGWFKTESMDWRHPDGLRHWNPEAHGFRRTTVSHSHCSTQSIHCVPFRKLEFPAMENGRQVTAYRWRLDGPLDDSGILVGEVLPVDSGAMILEGRLQDLSFEDVPVKTVRRRMKCQRRREEEGREDESHDQCGCYVIPCPRDDEIAD
jgi:hypothetical protein